jgi:uncharacterized protein (DUF427 family)
VLESRDGPGALVRVHHEQVHGVRSHVQDAKSHTHDANRHPGQPRSRGAIRTAAAGLAGTRRSGMFGMTALPRAPLETAMTDNPAGDVRIETSRKRVRVYLAGELVADTRSPLLVWEWPYYPTYYVPAADVRAELISSGGADRHAALGAAELLNVKVPTATAENAARRYPSCPVTGLRDAVRLEWKAMSEWLEEDEPVYVHARDPYHRVDILASTRHVRIEVDGVTVAESRQPRMLFETGLPPRYYLPLTDVRMGLLRPSDTHTSCPYKGTADYWSVDAGQGLHEDIAWIYRTPLPESQKVAGLACFYDEKVDVFIDGERQDRPQTPFS